MMLLSLSNACCHHCSHNVAVAADFNSHGNSRAKAGGEPTNWLAGWL
jgi:hypothetical protein